MPGAALVPLSSDTVVASLPPDASASPIDTLASVASPDGYSLGIPSGWIATDLSNTDGVALTDALAGRFVPLALLNPSYLRASEAELAKRRRDAA